MPVDWNHVFSPWSLVYFQVIHRLLKVLCSFVTDGTTIRFSEIHAYPNLSKNFLDPHDILIHQKGKPVVCSLSHLLPLKLIRMYYFFLIVELCHINLHWVFLRLVSRASWSNFVPISYSLENLTLISESAFTVCFEVCFS